MGYTFGNLVLRLCLRVDIKLNFQPYIRRYTSPNENFEHSYTLFVYLLHMSRAMRKLAVCIMKTSEFNAYKCE